MTAFSDYMAVLVSSVSRARAIQDPQCTVTGFACICDSILNTLCSFFAYHILLSDDVGDYMTILKATTVRMPYLLLPVVFFLKRML